MSVADMTPYEIKDDVTYFADIEIADHGTITVQLDQKSAPITVANFATLASNGFYDG
ncbi:MAG: peptidylprolyl isomerase, partial [Clostridia bacterium]|nr:peptidylprolyl isomerase [Clostridia bacterium]